MFKMEGVCVRLLAAFFLLCFVGVVFAEDRKGDITDVDSDDALVSGKKAKTFLRVKRGWRVRFRRIKGLWGEEDREEESAKRERNREASHRAWLNSHCPANCWGAWGGWSACNTPCGSNRIQSSSRSRAVPSACTAWVNSNGCPGPSSRTRACPHNCQNGGTPQPGKCACKAGWQGTCCDQRIKCGFPGKPSHGQVTPSSTSHDYGTTVRFSCDTGYSMSGTATRTCGGTGQWNNAVPTCNIIKCSDPGTPSHGSRSGSDFSYGKSVVYTCNTGYRLSGSSTRTCQANGQWNGSPASCSPVPCPKLSSPTGGSVSAPSSPVFGSKATYTCNAGRHLTGSNQRNCLASGQWSGSEPTCKEITCSALPTLANGRVTPTGAVSHGGKVTYSCNQGYTLAGNNQRTCGGTGPQGVWSGTQPTCNPVSCGDPGAPANGARVGSTYTYPSVVSFVCLPGYYMQGGNRITCGANGKWSGTKPTCTACAKNTYKSGSNVQTICAACPANSNTASTASADVKQCVCNTGFEGPGGGPCTEIRCTALPVPDKGRIVSCDTKYNSVCRFDCVDGHILSSGDASRTCRLDKSWSGAAPVCTACPKNTYKEDQGKCSACPSNSHTDSTGNMKTGCVCNTGYSGAAGGPCNDINECSASKGGCEQACQNTPGSFKCICNIPGYAVDPSDPKGCVATKQCSALPEPDNGGAVCSLIFETNTKRCQIKCNPGYDHLDRPNVFEQCGPTTDWKWSYEVKGEEIPPCVEEFFPGVQNELEMFYFVSDCTSLTAEEKRNLRISFIAMLRNQGICKQGNQDVCRIDDVRINCGKKDAFGFDFRRKRSTSEATENVIQFKFKIQVQEISAKNVDCSPYCKGINVTSERCRDICRNAYKNDTSSKVNTASTNLKNIFKDNVKVEAGKPPQGSSVAPPKNVTAPEKLLLKVGSKTLFPATSKVKVSSVPITCERGTVARDSEKKCIACPAGTFALENKCVPCPVGTHQPRPRQVRCWPCPPRSNSPKPGAKACQITSF